MDQLLAGGSVPLMVAGGVAVVVAVLGGVLTVIGPWYENLNFPSWRPPNWLFGPAWTLIFTLTACAAAIAWNTAPADKRALLVVLFGINAVLNVAWSGIFFRMRRPDLAFYEVMGLWLSILVLIVFIAGWSSTGALLLVPYIAWVSFAAYLNRTMVRLTAPF
jgi:benzodiazapine receptor